MIFIARPTNWPFYPLTLFFTSLPNLTNMFINHLTENWLRACRQLIRRRKFIFMITLKKFGMFKVNKWISHEKIMFNKLKFFAIEVRTTRNANLFMSLHRYSVGWRKNWKRKVDLINNSANNFIRWSSKW
jgi:hypothetical protein